MKKFLALCLALVMVFGLVSVPKATAADDIVPLGNKLDVKVINEEGGTATTDPAPGIVAPGTKVNVLVTKKDGYRAIVTVDPKPEWTDVAKYEFTMPKADTTVTVEFVEIQSSEKHNVYVKIKNPDCGNAYADPSKDVAMNEGVTLYFEPKLGYKAEYTIEPEGLKTDGNYTFMMPNRDVTVYVEFVKEGIIPFGNKLDVEVINEEGGTATTDPAPGIVAPGTKVNVLVTKKDGYRAIVTVDPEPEWTDVAKYEFTMPKADTTVTVEFVKEGIIPSGNKLDVKIINEEGGKAVTNPAAPCTLAAGTKVSLTVTPKSGYKSIVTTKPEIKWTAVNKSMNGGIYYAFDMPDEDTTITVEFVKKVEKEHSVELKVTGGIGYVATAGMTEQSKVQFIEAVPVGQKVTSSWESGTKVPVSAKFNGKEIDVNDITVKEYSATRTTYYYYFDMPDEDVLIEIVFAEPTVPEYKLNLKIINEEGGKAVTNPAAPCTLTAGTKVSLTVTPKSGYKSIVTTKPEIKWTAVNKSMNGGIYYAFDMPDEDTTITVEFVKKVEKEHSVELKVTGGIGYVATAGMTEQSKVQFIEAVPVGQKVTSSWESGTKVPVSAKFNGKEIDVNDIIVKEYSATRTTYYYYFDMPDEDVLIEIVFAEQVPEHEFWLEPETVDIYVGESATITAWYSYKGGEPVKLSPTKLGIFSAQDNDGVIKFDGETGELRAIKPGYCSITARYTPDGTGMKMHANVNVIVRPAARYYIYPDTLNITVGDTFNLDNDIEVWYGFSEGGYQKVTANYWCVVRNDGVLQVEEQVNGTVHSVVTETDLIALAEGTATLRAFYTAEDNNKIATDLTVNVAPAPEEYDAFIGTLGGSFGDIQIIRYTFLVKNTFEDPTFALTVGGASRPQVTDEDSFYKSKWACWWLHDGPTASTTYEGYTQYVIWVKLFAKQYNTKTAFTITSDGELLKIKSFERLANGIHGTVDTSVSYSMVDLAGLYAILRPNGEAWAALKVAMADFADKLNVVADTGNTGN